MFQVETFRNAKAYYGQFTYHKEELHLAPTSALARIIEICVGREHVWVISDFFRRLFPEWHDPLTQVYLSGRLRSLIYQVAPAQLAEKLSTRIPELLNSFLMMAELADVRLQEHLAPSEESRVVGRLFQILQQDRYVRRYAEQRERLTKNELRARFQLSRLARVIVHQLDYLDVSRMMLFHQLRQIGLQVIFRIPYDPQWKRLYRGWKEIYQAVSLKQDTAWPVLQETCPVQGEKFASYLEGTEGGGDDPLKVKTLIFRHPLDFKKYLRQQSRHEKPHVLAMNADELNHYMTVQASPQIFSSPYGRLFRALAECRREGETVYLHYETYVDLITSGWFDTHAISGMDGLGLLCDLKPYMNGVQSLAEVLERLQSLSDLQQFSQVFDQQAKEQAQRHLPKRYLCNPFRAFSYVHVSRYAITVKQLIELTKVLERRLAHLLLAPRQSVSVKTYLMTLKTLFEQVKGQWPQEVASAFEAVFHQSVPDDWSFEMQEMIQFFHLLLTKGQADEEPVQPFPMVSGLALGSEALHITDLSMRHFPLKALPMPAYLTHTWLKQSILQAGTVKNKTIYLHALLVDYHSRLRVKEQSIYHLYHALANCEGTLTFSWIEHLHDEDAPSIYLRMISQLYGSGNPVVFTATDEPWEPQPSGEMDPAISLAAAEAAAGWDQAAEDMGKDGLETALPEPALLDVLAELPELYWLDLDFCARKFALNALIEQQPVYEDDFHQRLLFGMIGRLLTQPVHGREDFEEAVYPLFPQWTRTLKENLIDTEFWRPLRDYKKYENIYYPKAMQAMQILRSQYLVTKRRMVRNRYQDDTFKPREAMKELAKHLDEHAFEAEKGAHCRMCPHLRLCTEGEYAIDVRVD